MDPLVTSALISTGGSLLGNLFGGGMSAASSARFNYRTQKEFAKNQIGWRVADAKRAGIHPLAALGMNPASSSPVAVPGESSSGDVFRDAGQNIGRAIASGQTTLERLNERLIESQIAGQDLDNEYKAQEIMSRQNLLYGQVPPSISLNPSPQEMSAQDELGRVAASNPFWQRYTDISGDSVWGPHGSNASESAESILGSTLMLPQIIYNAARRLYRGRWRGQGGGD